MLLTREVLLKFLLMPEAKSQLNGHSLSSLMGAVEEAFVHFLIITDFMKHHFNSVCNLVTKYKYLVPEREVCSQLDSVLENWVGMKGVPKKGFRSTDITFYQRIKAHVMEKHHTNMKGSP